MRWKFGSDDIQTWINQFLNWEPPLGVHLMLSLKGRDNSNGKGVIIQGVLSSEHSTRRGNLLLTARSSKEE